jgi:hypothetical protein
VGLAVRRSDRLHIRDITNPGFDFRVMPAASNSFCGGSGLNRELVQVIIEARHFPEGHSSIQSARESVEKQVFSMFGVPPLGGVFRESPKGGTPNQVASPFQ